MSLAAAVLFAAIGLGVRIPGLGFLSPFARASALDYSSNPGTFAPLDPAYVTDVLGLRFPDDAAAPRGGGDSVIPSIPSIPGKTFPSFHPPVPFTNDSFASPITAAEVPFTATTNASSATREPNETRACSVSGGTSWFRYDSRDGGRTLIANTIGSDQGTTLGVFTGEPPTAVQTVGCDSNAAGNAEYLFVPAANTTYFFQVAWLSRHGIKLVFNLDPIGETERVPRNVRPNGQSHDTAISGDGRYVAFTSDSTNLVPGANRRCPSVPGLAAEVTNQVTYPDSIACPQAYVFDRDRGRLEHVSVSSGGAPSDARVEHISISADGRYVAFASAATNLAGRRSHSDPPPYAVFVRDRVRRTTDLVSVSSNGLVPNGDSFFPQISGNGRYVVFQSVGSDLVPADTNGDWDAFVRDLMAGATERVSLTSSGDQSQGGGFSDSISFDGRYVVFKSSASDLVPGDRNGLSDVFVRDRLTGSTERVSVTWQGGDGNGSSGQTSGDHISNDGRYVAFVSHATNLVPGDSNRLLDVFVRDRFLARTIRVSVTSAGEEGHETQRALLRDRVTLVPTCSISGDGRFVVFDTLAADLTPYDRNALADLYLHDLLTGATLLMSTTPEGRNGNLHSVVGAISNEGGWVAFLSYATDLVRNDVRANGAQVFVHEIDFGP